jgi:hypothetical protein
MFKDKYFKTPDELYDLFLKYKDELKSNPRKKHTFVGKDGKPEFELLERPLTMEGFRSYSRRIKGSIEHYFANTDESYSDYRTVCNAIREEIRQDQIEGGMVGQYNASITQRLNGLKEQTENVVTNNVKLLSIDPLDDSNDNSTSEDSKP